MLSKQDLTFIKNVFPFWNQMEEKQQKLLLDNIIETTYVKGTTVHRGGTECVGVLIIKSGELRTYILSEEGKEVTLFRLKSGDVCLLSASCIFRSITFDVHVDAEQDSEVLLLNSTVYQQLINQNIYIENFSYKNMIERFSDVIWSMEQLLFMSFDKRLAVFLLDEMASNQTDTIDLTHEQIAKYIGSAREVVSRMLKRFKEKGIVELSRGGIKITDKKKLRNMI